MKRKIFLSILAILFTIFVVAFLNGFTPTTAFGIISMEVTDSDLYHNPKIKLGSKYMQRLFTTKNGEDDLIEFFSSKKYILTNQENNIYTFEKDDNYMVLTKTEFLGDYYIWQSITEKVNL